MKIDMGSLRAAYFSFGTMQYKKRTRLAAGSTRLAILDGSGGRCGCNTARLQFVERLEERLGRPQEARFDLSYTITTKSIGVGVTPENATPRYNITGQVDWALKDHTGAAILTGIAQSFTSWSATGSTVAGLAAEEDASYRLMRILADQIVTRLLAASGTFL